MDLRVTNPIFLVANLFLFASWYYAACFVLPTRFRKGYIMLIWLVFFSVFSLFAPLLEKNYPNIRNTLLIVCEMLLFLGLYKGKWYARILCFFLFTGLTLLVELLFVGLFQKNRELLDIPTAELIFDYCIYIILNAFVDMVAVVVIRQIKESGQTNLSLKEFLLFSLYIISIIQMIVGMGNIVGQETGYAVISVYMLPLLLLCVLTMVSLGVIIRRVLERAQLCAENDYIQHQLELQTDFYSGLAAHYRNLCRQRHDLANHLLAVNLLISEGKYEEATVYISQLDERLEENEEP